jgi:hypothetical protein
MVLSLSGDMDPCWDARFLKIPILNGVDITWMIQVSIIWARGIMILLMEGLFHQIRWDTPAALVCMIIATVIR